MLRVAPALALSLAGSLAGCVEGADVSLGELPDRAGSLGPPGEAGLDSAAAAPDAAAGCEAGEPVPAARSALLAEAIGFGRSATGGLSGCVYHVTDLGDSGPGTLRDAAGRPDPLWIVFDRSGDIALASDIEVRSDKTIDGRGQAITVRNYGVSIVGPTSNVVIENLAFVGRDAGSSSDAIHLADGAARVWVDHCSLSQYGDGLVDITGGATDVTVSWSRFFRHDLVMLIGAETDTDDAGVQVTLHHNDWEQIGNYAPRVRFGRVHLFNNLIDRWTDGAAAVTMGGELASEGNVFAAGSNAHAIQTKAGADSEPGFVRSTGDWLQGDAEAEENQPDRVFRPSDSYAYSVAPADSSLVEAIAAGVGAR